MDWRHLGRKILFPPVWLLCLLTISSTVLLTMVFVKGWEESVLAYGVYVLSFYTLTALCAFCALVFPKHYRQVRQRISSNPVGGRIIRDKRFRAELSLYVSLGVNLLYVALQVVQWYVFRSWWFVILAMYYSILSVMRFLLVRYIQQHKTDSSLTAEWKSSRACGGVLLLMNLSLSGAVLMILYQNRGFRYEGFLIYVIALHTFYSTIHAAVDIVRYRKLGSPVISTAKIISLSAALVSMLNLETAMLEQFGSDLSQETKRIFIVLTGAGVSIMVIMMSVYLIRRATKVIRSENNGA